MATFIISNPEIKKVTKPGNNLNKPYVRFNIRLKNDIYGKTRTLTSFEQGAVDAWSAILPISKGGTAQAEQPIPEEMKYITGVFVDFVPAQKFHKIHLSDHPAGTKMIGGQMVQTPAIKAGELVKANGIPVVFTTLRVFCRQYFDDTTNQFDYCDGESPIEVGQRAYQAYCLPITENNTPQTVETDAFEPAMTINATGGTIQPQQQVQQPAQAPYQQPVQPQQQQYQQQMPPQGVI